MAEAEQFLTAKAWLGCQSTGAIGFDHVGVVLRSDFSWSFLQLDTGKVVEASQGSEPDVGAWKSTVWDIQKLAQLDLHFAPQSSSQGWDSGIWLGIVTFEKNPPRFHLVPVSAADPEDFVPADSP